MRAKVTILTQQGSKIEPATKFARYRRPRFSRAVRSPVIIKDRSAQELSDSVNEGPAPSAMVQDPKKILSTFVVLICGR